MPFRAQVGSRTLPGDWGTRLLAPFWAKMVPKGAILGTPLDPKLLQNHAFEHRSALRPSKNDLWKGVRKKHENSMKKRCKNRRFLMAQNHVWRYTLRLFYTFGISERNRQIDAKREHKRSVFGYKSRPWAPQGRLIHSFWLILEVSKNIDFSKSALGVNK